MTPSFGTVSRAAMPGPARVCCQAAFAVRLPLMIRTSSARDAPSANKERTMRSRETDPSPDSIFATRDWLDLSNFATSACVRCRSSLKRRRPSAMRSLISMYASSSGDVPRNSVAVPTRHPRASSRFLLSSRIVVLPKSSSANSDHSTRCGLGLLLEDLDDHDRVVVDAVHHTVQPGERLICGAHGVHDMSNLTFAQATRRTLHHVQTRRAHRARCRARTGARARADRRRAPRFAQQAAAGSRPPLPGGAGAGHRRRRARTMRSFDTNVAAHTAMTCAICQTFPNGSRTMPRRSP